MSKNYNPDIMKSYKINNEIKVSELLKVNIKSIDTALVKDLLKTLKRKLISSFIFIFLNLTFFSFLLYKNIKNNTITSNNLIIIFIFLIALSLFLLIYISKQISNVIKYNCKKAQYGIVQKKYSLRDPGESSIEDYYVDVLFPNTNTYIRKVNCTYKTFKDLKEYEDVLVISFDNKKAYALAVNINRKSNIAEKENSTELKVSELLCVNINNSHKTAIMKIAKKLNKKYKRYFFILFFFFINFSLAIYNFIKINTIKFIIDIAFFSIIFLFLLTVLIYLSKQIIYTSKGKYKKAQYGIVKNKYISQDKLKYFVNVLFSNENAYIREVVCINKNIYYSLSEGNQILVISFDNKTAYAVTVNT